MSRKLSHKLNIWQYSYDPENFVAQIDLYCRWLYQTARADRKPRVLFLGGMDVATIYLFIDRIKQVVKG